MFSPPSGWETDPLPFEADGAAGPGGDRSATGAEQAVSSGMTEHTVSLATQLTTHAMTAAPTVSRFAEVASALRFGNKPLPAPRKSLPVRVYSAAS